MIKITLTTKKAISTFANKIVGLKSETNLEEKFNIFKMPFSRLKKFSLYCKNIKSTGAIYETSHSAGSEVTKYIDKGQRQTIVEFGSGTGNITKLIAGKMHKDSVLHCFEMNDEMISYLKERFNYPNVIIHHLSAWEFTDVVREPIDIVISSLPISFFSKTAVDELLNKVARSLNKNGVFSQMLYNYFYKRKTQRYFTIIRQKSIYWDIPWIHIFHSTTNK